MKKLTFIIAVATFLTSGAVSAQDLSQSEVPAHIVSQFQKDYSKARKIDWERDGNLYKVEFETGLRSKDHEIWYNDSAKVTRHEEEISTGELPAVIKATIRKDFTGFRAKDIERITTDKGVFYKMDLESPSKEWKVSFDEKGKLLKKRAD